MIRAVLLAAGASGCCAVLTDPPDEEPPPPDPVPVEAPARVEAPEPAAPPAPPGPPRDCPDPPEVRYDGKVFSATFCGADGQWAGATLRRAADSAHFDLPAVPVEGDAVTVSGEVGPGFVQYLVGSWSEKTPCTTGRHGCVAYGYQLEGEVDAYPPGAYGGSHHDFADLQPVRARVMDAGGRELAGKVREHLVAKRWEAIDGGAATKPRSQVEILYRARWDRVRAWQIASELREAELGVRWTVEHWPEAPDAFVVAVGAP